MAEFRLRQESNLEKYRLQWGSGVWWDPKITVYTPDQVLCIRQEE